MRLSVVAAACALCAVACSYGTIEVHAGDAGDAGDDAGPIAGVGGTGGSGGSVPDDGGPPDDGRVPDASGGSDAGAGGRSGGGAGDGPEDTGDDDDDDGGSEPLHVDPLSAAAPDWNDYVLASKLETACPASSPAPDEGCVHAGALRVLALADESSCGALEIEDQRGWFDWECIDEGDSILLRTMRLRPGIGLRDLIDLDEREWRTNHVTVTRGSSTVARTESAQFWTNPILPVPATTAGVVELDQPSAVYVLTETVAADLRIVEDGVSLVAAGGVQLQTAASGNPLLAVDAGRRVFFLWIDGVHVLADDHAVGVDLDRLGHSVVRNILVTRDAAFGASTGANLRIDADDSTLEQLDSNRSAGSGVELDGTGNTVSDVTVFDPAGDGLDLRMGASVVSGLRVQSAGGAGVRLRGVTASLLDNVTVANCDGAGVVFESDTRGDVLADFVVGNNGASGVLVQGSDHRVVLGISASNANDGIRVDGVNVLLQHTTTTNNAQMGLHATPTAVGVQIVNALTTNNQGGLWLNDDSSYSLVHDLWVASNGGGVLVEGDHNLFSGALALGGTNHCALLANPDQQQAPGLTVPCGNADGSTASLTFDSALQSMMTPIDDGVLAGMQLVSDPLNAAVDPVSGERAYGEITDWVSFSNRFRHWGRPAAENGFFPNPPSIGRCDAISACAYWDWRVSQLPSRARDPLGTDAPTLLTRLELPLHARSQTWSALDETSCGEIPGARWNDPVSGCATPFLANAYEMRDGVDDDDYLCSPGESCTLNRNRGAYPGHGDDPLDLGPLNPGEADGETDVPGFGSVTLRMYPDNGE